MALMKLLGFGSEKLPSIIKDPFGKTKVIAIRVHYSKSIFSDNFSASGTVEFSNGNTKGEQRFDGETFDDVVLQIKAMLQTLE